MRIDDARRAIDDAGVPWDDVRERRVLGRVERSIDDRARARRRARVRARVGGSIAAAAAVVLLAVGLLWMRLAQPDPAPARSIAQAQPSETPAVASERPTIPETSAPTMALADGSRAILDRGAHVDVDVQTDDLVRLVQSSGVVHYEVARNPARRFVVDAAGVEVRVIGTMFSVSIEDARVRVAVDRGRVEVEGQNGVLELGPGDELSVPAPDEIAVVVEPDAPQPASPSAETPTKRPRPASHSVDTLLTRADSARASGDLAGAAQALGELVRTHPKDPRTYSSWFQLGKIERARRRHAAAAAAFTACYRRSPAGSLSEDARAEAAVSWRDAGKTDRAHKTAQTYLQRYPGGAHTERMRRILDRAP